MRDDRILLSLKLPIPQKQGGLQLSVLTQNTLDRDGYEIWREVLNFREIEKIKNHLTKQPAEGAGSRIRLSEHIWLTDLICSPKIRGMIESHLGSRAAAVRALFFDKRPEANWSVRWHQDKTIAVKAKIPTGGYCGWSLKEGVLHVHPPVEVMENMLALRLHLDPAGPQNGGLRVYPGSHRFGYVKDKTLSETVKRFESVPTDATAGDAILMRPLLLHSSERCQSGRRRVLHIEFASNPLPGPLEWNEFISLS